MLFFTKGYEENFDGCPAFLPKTKLVCLRHSSSVEQAFTVFIQLSDSIGLRLALRLGLRLRFRLGLRLR